MYSRIITVRALICESDRIIKVPSLSIAIFPAEAPSCIVLAELAARSSTAAEELHAAAAASHRDDEAVSPSTDVDAQDSDNSAHVGT